MIRCFFSRPMKFLKLHCNPGPFRPVGVKKSHAMTATERAGKLAAKTYLARLGRRLLEHPLTNGLDLDDPKTTELRKQILASKPFLRAIYEEWYSKLRAEAPPGTGAALELGSGAGHCEQFIPDVIKSELILRECKSWPTGSACPSPMRRCGRSCS